MTSGNDYVLMKPCGMKLDTHVYFCTSLKREILWSGQAACDCIAIKCLSMFFPVHHLHVEDFRKLSSIRSKTNNCLPIFVYHLIEYNIQNPTFRQHLLKHLMSQDNVILLTNVAYSWLSILSIFGCETDEVRHRFIKAVNNSVNVKDHSYEQAILKVVQKIRIIKFSSEQRLGAVLYRSEGSSAAESKARTGSTPVKVIGSTANANHNKLLSYCANARERVLTFPPVSPKSKQQNPRTRFPPAHESHSTTCDSSHYQHSKNSSDGSGTRHSRTDDRRHHGLLQSEMATRKSHMTTGFSVRQVCLKTIRSTSSTRHQRDKASNKETGKESQLLKDLEDLEASPLRVCSAELHINKQLRAKTRILQEDYKTKKEDTKSQILEASLLRDYSAELHMNNQVKAKPRHLQVEYQTKKEDTKSLNSYLNGTEDAQSYKADNPDVNETKDVDIEDNFTRSTQLSDITEASSMSDAKLASQETTSNSMPDKMNEARRLSINRIRIKQLTDKDDSHLQVGHRRLSVRGKSRSLSIQRGGHDDIFHPDDICKCIVDSEEPRTYALCIPDKRERNQEKFIIINFPDDIDLLRSSPFLEGISPTSSGSSTPHSLDLSVFYDSPTHSHPASPTESRKFLYPSACPAFSIESSFPPTEFPKTFESSDRRASLIPIDRRSSLTDRRSSLIHVKRESVKT